MISVVIASALSQRIDMRWMITVGLSLFAYSLWLSSHMTSQWGFWELFLPQALRGLAMMLCIVPSREHGSGRFSACRAEVRFRLV